jgi:hypothetical protein
MKQVANTACRQNKFLGFTVKAKLHLHSWKDYGRTTGQKKYTSFKERVSLLTCSQNSVIYAVQNLLHSSP